MGDLSAKYEDLGAGDEVLGGRSLTARYVSREVNPTCDPLGPENKLFIACNIFTGVSLSTATGRISFGSKSPLTGTIKEASVGGTAGTYMVKHGIKVIAIEGCPQNQEDLYILRIDKDGNPSLSKADDFKGMLNYPMVAKFHELYTDDIAVICGGVAGEKKSPVSAIMVTDFAMGYPTRAAARGGLGAVMTGTKRIKAIVFEKPNTPYEIKYADEEKYRKAAKSLTKMLELSPNAQTRKRYGTLASMAKNEMSGILPVRNFRSEPFEWINDISGETFYNTVTSRGGRVGLACCPGCVVRCSQEYVDAEGKHIAGAVQYETTGLCGSNLNIHDFDTIAHISRACDDYGVDTIEIGAALGTLMEAGQIEWGSGEQVLKMLDEMKNGTEKGSLLLLGLTELGKRLGIKRLPHVKGQSFPAYDPRGSFMHGMAFVFGTQGADHTLALPPPGKIPENFTEVALDAMALMVVAESAFCLLAAMHFTVAPDTWKHYFDMMSGLYGGAWTMDRMISDIGIPTVKLEKEFNKKAGVEPGVLPGFLYEEASKVTGKPYTIPEDELVKIFHANYAK